MALKNLRTGRQFGQPGLSNPDRMTSMQRRDAVSKEQGATQRENALYNRTMRTLSQRLRKGDARAGEKAMELASQYGGGVPGGISSFEANRAQAAQSIMDREDLLSEANGVQSPTGQGAAVSPPPTASLAQRSKEHSAAPAGTTVGLDGRSYAPGATVGALSSPAAPGPSPSPVAAPSIGASEEISDLDRELLAEGARANARQRGSDAFGTRPGYGLLSSRAEPQRTWTPEKMPGSVSPAASMPVTESKSFASQFKASEKFLADQKARPSMASAPPSPTPAAPIAAPPAPASSPTGGKVPAEPVSPLPRLTLPRRQSDAYNRESLSQLGGILPTHSRSFGLSEGFRRSDWTPEDEADLVAASNQYTERKLNPTLMDRVRKLYGGAAYADSSIQEAAFGDLEARDEQAWERNLRAAGVPETSAAEKKRLRGMSVDEVIAESRRKRGVATVK